MNKILWEIAILEVKAKELGYSKKETDKMTLKEIRKIVKEKIKKES